VAVQLIPSVSRRSRATQTMLSRSRSSPQINSALLSHEIASYPSLGPTSRSEWTVALAHRCRRNQQTSNRQEQRVSDAQAPTPTCGS
jgi:hypothetical protein